MLNHVRTLLLNVSGANTPGYDFPGEEMVDASYRPFEPPSYLAALRTQLFGARPDRLYRNYRLRQYLTLLHATELVEFVTALDSRISYSTGLADPYVGAFGIRVEGSTAPFYVSGQPEADESLGRLMTQWRVAVGNGSVATVFRETPPVDESQHAIEIVDSLSREIPLGDGLTCAFEPTPGLSWRITATARPTRELPDIVAALRDSTSEVTANALFGVVPEEPYRTFRNLWNDHEILPYQLGGLVLAVAYRSHEIWSRR